MQTITPRLIVSSVARAIEFYSEALGGREIERFTLPNGHVVHALVAFGSSFVSFADEAPHWQMRGPSALGGSPVLLTIECENPDAVCARAVQLGAKVIIKLADQLYGRREGRIQDPFGHLWILSKLIEQISAAEIKRRMAAS